ncbi:hypothetical protein [Fluviicola taffensis]|uniref:Lipoprotein n=1 Tax=Fluviicola taffensis (strain DSM 16823 / NCIMB 13979 / RW262) TaxID=755732 RepID=F2IDU7_FLUTR|nr:hypothetical protein [Fluviicola taffensis]AEA44489.1 hypothetical protein Fluta_2504 [Fluviicola taffensis DSM 16823]
MLYRLLILFSLTFCLTGCPDFDKENKKIREEFKTNHFNLKLDKTLKYEGISFKLPSSFTRHFSHLHTVKNSSLTRNCGALNIYFSVERFDKKDLKRAFVSEYGIENDLLNTFQDAYVWRRYESLNEAGISIKKELPKSLKQKGVIQTVAGDGDYGTQTYYATSTIKVADNYYVFQWISSKPIMNYTYDDFERILKSIRKAK